MLLEIIETVLEDIDCKIIANKKKGNYIEFKKASFLKLVIIRIKKWLFKIIDQW